MDSLGAALTPGGRYHMLCFSDREPGTWGPHRVTLAELDEAFARTWRIDSVTSSTIDITTDCAAAAPTLRCTVRKL